jgi:hypothetical protein
VGGHPGAERPDWRGVPQDWATHMLGHELTAMHGLDHAQTLAIVLPALWNEKRDTKRAKLLQYAERVWNITEGSEDSVSMPPSPQPVVSSSRWACRRVCPVTVWTAAPSRRCWQNWKNGMTNWANIRILRWTSAVVFTKRHAKLLLRCLSFLDFSSRLNAHNLTGTCPGKLIQEECMTHPTVIKLSDGNLMPQLGLGVWKAGNEEVVSAIHKALEVGYRSIDTAAAYKNEDGVGTALKSAGVARDDLFITTKLWNDDQKRPQEALQESLDKLQLDYVDLYLMHWPVPAIDHYVEAWKGMIKLQEQGLVKSIGVCNFQIHHLQKLIDETA